MVEDAVAAGLVGAAAAGAAAGAADAAPAGISPTTFSVGERIPAASQMFGSATDR